ncbi:MAG: cyclic nucleotide-binding domain-containing protein [Acidobacteriota bacterium]
MPQEHKSRREVLDAIRSLPALSALLSTHDGHFDFELDLEVSVYGRNYRGKKVGPYLRLLSYRPGETVIEEGAWGGNTFYVVVNGLIAVFVNAPNGERVKVAELQRGAIFGEMAVLAGTPHNATMIVAPDQNTKILEIQRPALRLLRKLTNFSDDLDRNYRRHGRRTLLEDLRLLTGVSIETIDALKKISTFRIFSKNHTLFRQGETINRLYIIKQGWMKRRYDFMMNDQPQVVEDYLGKGYFFGLEGLSQNQQWQYTAELMSRAEVLEISINKLRQTAEIQDNLEKLFARFHPPQIGSRIIPGKDVTNVTLGRRILMAQQEVITTGLVDANNLLVMDMDLCVRCGNCSLACHQIHGQSRLTRRGIHIIRLSAAKLGARQSVLSPEVCMHCADPECLTGCPTGAIGRFEQGQVDIEPKLCIGCGDCATQCPYDAISMVPRKRATPDTNKNFAWRIKDLLRLQPDPLPAAVDATEDLVAVKCNLCTGTTLNPAKNQKAKYSCEENCPTGALARITPSQYFNEVGQIEGLFRIDETHAIGRNIHKSDPLKRLLHVGGIGLTAALLIATWFGLKQFGLGGSIFGTLNMRWITGLVGLAGIVWVMGYAFRRQVYTRRRGALRYWLLVHAYAGVIAGLMLLIHGGNDSGGWLTTLLMWSFDAVIATGIFGIFCYAVAPRLLTKIEGSPLLIDDLKTRREELRREIGKVAGSPSEAVRYIAAHKVVPRFISISFLLRQYLKRERLEDMLDAAKADYQAVAAQLAPDESRELTRAIEAAATLRRVDALIYLHRLLKLWLPPHVLFTSLMLALMLVHIFQVVFYLAR